jgi:hypothetical protein
MMGSEELYEGLLGVTRKYLTEASVRAAIGTALKRSGDSEQGLTVGHLPEVVAEAMVGLRLFCEPEKFGDLMMDLTEYCELVSSDSAEST